MKTLTFAHLAMKALEALLMTQDQRTEQSGNLYRQPMPRRQSEESRAAQRLYEIKKKDNETYRHLIALIKILAR